MIPTLLLVVVIAVLLAVIGWLVYERRRSSELRTSFGAEYERTVQQAGNRGEAEDELRERQERVNALDIRPLSAADRDRFAGEWRDVQANFVDQPVTAIDDADGLIGQVMAARGYPMSDFDQRAADISVDHADVVEHYRAAHAIAQRRDEGDTDTEALRQAMVHYRALFDELVGSTNGTDLPPADQQPTTNQPELTRRAS